MNSEKHKISNSELMNRFENIGCEIYFIYGCIIYIQNIVPQLLLLLPFNSWNRIYFHTYSIFFHAFVGTFLAFSCPFTKLHMYLERLSGLSRFSSRKIKKKKIKNNSKERTIKKWNNRQEKKKEKVDRKKKTLVAANNTYEYYGIRGFSSVSLLPLNILSLYCFFFTLNPTRARRRDVEIVSALARSITGNRGSRTAGCVNPGWQASKQRVVGLSALSFRPNYTRLRA